MGNIKKEYIVYSMLLLGLIFASYLQLNTEKIMFSYFLYLFLFCYHLYNFNKSLKIPVLKQILIINGIILLFLYSAFKYRSPELHPSLQVRGFILVYTSLLFFITNFLSIYTFKKAKYYIESITKFFTNNKLLLVLITIIVLLRVFELNNIHRWDSGEYYNKLWVASNGFDFSFRNYIDTFQLAKHPTIGFSSIYAIGVYSFPATTFGVNLVSLILTITGMTCLFKLFDSYFNSLRKSFLATLIISCLPVVLGTFSYFNPDYGLAMFFLIFVYALHRKYYIVALFFAIIILQTKETGLVILGGYGFGILLFRLFDNKLSIKEKTLRVIRDKRIIVLLGALSTYICYMLYIGEVSAWRQNSKAGQNIRIISSDNDMNAFGIRASHITKELSEFFILNFQWLLLLLLVFIFIHSKVKKKKINLKFDTTIVAIIGSLGSFLLFSLFFIAAELARYKVTFTISLSFLILLVFFKYVNLTYKYFNTKIIASIILVLCISQAYLTIDIVSLIFFEKLTTNKLPMLYVNGGDRKHYYGDSLVYNYQYTYVEKAFNYIFKEEDYSGEENVILFGDMSGVQLNGNGQVYKIFWDKEKQKRVMHENENTTTYDFINGDELEGRKNSLKENAIAIFLPHYNVDEKLSEENLLKYYDIVKRKSYSSLTVEVNYLTLKLK